MPFSENRSEINVIKPGLESEYMRLTSIVDMRSNTLVLEVSEEENLTERDRDITR